MSGILTNREIFYEIVKVVTLVYRHTGMTSMCRLYESEYSAMQRKVIFKLSKHVQ